MAYGASASTLPVSSASSLACARRTLHRASERKCLVFGGGHTSKNLQGHVAWCNCIDNRYVQYSGAAAPIRHETPITSLFTKSASLQCTAQRNSNTMGYTMCLIISGTSHFSNKVLENQIRRVRGGIHKVRSPGNLAHA